MTTVRYLKRCWKHSKFNANERIAIQEKVDLLRDYRAGAINLHSLDIELLAGTRHRWKRLKFGKVRVFFIQADDEIVIGEIHRRDTSTYDDVTRLNQYVISRRGSGIAILGPGDGDAIEDAPVEAGPGIPMPIPAVERELPNPLTQFSTPELTSAGIPADLVKFLRTLGEGIDVGEALIDRNVDSELVELILGMWTAPETAREIYDAGGVPSLEDVTIGPEEFARRVASDDSSASLAELTEREFERVLEGSVEEWMFYLHPTQLRIVKSAPTGPMRVRGGPGTGKTVVGLHRARWLIQNGHADSVLMTTFTRVLPKLWEGLFNEFAKDEAPQIETATIDKIAADIVTKTDGPFRAATHGEIRKAMTTELVLQKVSPAVMSPEALHTEIDQVILGRRLDKDGYLAIERRGRGQRLDRATRERVWAAYENYRARLRRNGKTDWAHVRARALELVEAGHGPRFDAIIVDEAQDLTEAHVRLLLALDADSEHKNMMFVGDGQQRIYLGGYSLRSVGIDVRGRSHPLITNWRNTQRIMQAAEAFIGDLTFGDLDDETKIHRDADALPLPQRIGTQPVLHLSPDIVTTETALTMEVESLLTRFDHEDIAVLVQTNRETSMVERMLSPIPTRDLSADSWMSDAGISIGTQARSKGLEFKAVIVLSVNENAIRTALSDAVDKDDALEKWQRTVFVAMTRGRDELVVIGTTPIAKQLEASRESFCTFVW
jgi:hypothetical protein